LSTIWTSGEFTFSRISEVALMAVVGCQFLTRIAISRKTR